MGKKDPFHDSTSKLAHGFILCIKLKIGKYLPAAFQNKRDKFRIVCKKKDIKMDELSL